MIDPAKTCFVSLVSDPAEAAAARLMIASLREFGGVLADSLLRIYQPGPQHVIAPQPEVDVIQIVPPDWTQTIPFGTMVYTCAQAENQITPWCETLVWIAPQVLVVQPPLLYALDEAWQAALRPVHLCNVGLSYGAAPDGFWAKIFTRLGMSAPEIMVQSFVDNQRLHAYFNTHAFSINPRLGLLQEWLDHFQYLATDRVFRRAELSDEIHHVFLFQAIWSALLSRQLGAEHLRILPAQYNYPYHLHGRVPVEQRAQTLDELVTVAWEEEIPRPEHLHASEPLRTWLAERT